MTAVDAVSITLRIHFQVGLPEARRTIARLTFPEASSGQVNPPAGHDHAGTQPTTISIIVASCKDTSPTAPKATVEKYI